ncbi:MAG: glycosyltransferase N-terminal domain-containing protein [Pseudomonadota bacterium]
MTRPRTPWQLHAYLLATRLFAWPITLVFMHLHARMGASPERFSERLGKSTRGTTEDVIWFHAASLGEVAQIGALATQLARDEQKQLLVTTTTLAGVEWVQRELPDAFHQFVPMDTPSAVAGFLDNWRISIAIFVEGDLWPRLTLETARRKVPQVLLNARHSRTRERFAKVYAVLLNSFACLTCRSDQVAIGIRALGLSHEKIHVVPDLRTGSAKLPCSPDELTKLRAEIGERPVWLAASTHPADELHVFDAQRHIIRSAPNTLLVFAPRHPRRGDDLQSIARERGFTVARRSAGDAITPQTQIYLADTLGEMGLLYALAPLAFVGGSIGDEGGHNPYEPAQFGTAVLSGSQVRNFAQAYDALKEAGAAELLQDPTTLGGRIAELLGSDQAGKMGEAGHRFMRNSENSVAETITLIRDVLHNKDGAS